MSANKKRYLIKVIILGDSGYIYHLHLVLAKQTC